jgi:hypothetical protein
VILGLNFTLHGPQLMVFNQAIDMAVLKSIIDPQILNPPVAQSPNNVQLPMPQAAQKHAAQTSAPANQPSAQGHMYPIRPQDSVPPHGLRKVEVKPETKPNAKKVANMGKGNLNDAAMTQGLINKLNKEGAKAGMG